MTGKFTNAAPQSWKQVGCEKSTDSFRCMVAVLHHVFIVAYCGALLRGAAFRNEVVVTMDAQISDMLGRVLTGVEGCEKGSEEITFATATGERWHMYHGQDCCETVQLEDVCGDWQDLIGHPLLIAEEVSSEGHPPPEYADSYTWTFYRLGTVKGVVTLRWLGESNGYYSESVDFDKLG